MPTPRTVTETLMLRYKLSRGLFRGVGLSSGWPLKRRSTIYLLGTILRRLPDMTIQKLGVTRVQDKS